MKRVAILTQLFLSALSLSATYQPAGAGTIYVNASATGANNGNTWTNALTNLQSALGAAVSGDEIWVAAGIYKPTSGTDRTATFQLASGVAVYGGFSGTETTVNQRNWATNVTTLSGDIGVVSDFSDNSYNVVTGSGTNSTAVIDGFTMTEGYTDLPEGGGGGFYNETGSPTVSNIIVSNNYADWYGGGMYNVAISNPTLVNVVFAGNEASYGGGICNRDSSDATLINVTLNGNYANSGGGVYNDVSSKPRLVNVVFSGNFASYGGGICNRDSSDATLINVTLQGNLGSSGSAIYNSGGSTPTLANVVMWGNSEPQIVNDASSPTISYSLIQGSGGSGGGWNASLGIDGGNNLDTDPLFVDAPGANLRLGLRSLAIDTGDGTAIPPGVTTDIVGDSRVVGFGVDMGAFEFQCAPGSVIYVDKFAAGAGDGSSWSDALKELSDALFMVQWRCPVPEIWVAAGTYKPTTGDDRTASFQLVNGVAVYGGFSGTETMRSQRDWAANVTTLSGDIGNVGQFDHSDNSYHVATGSGTNATAVLDGFTVTFGYASGTAPNDRGAGLLNVAGSPAIVNVVFSENYASNSGGGVWNSASSNPALVNVVVWKNTAVSTGGGMSSESSSPTLINTTFSGNSAGSGGGIYNNAGSAPELVNVVLWGDSATSAGDEISNSGSTPLISYSLVSGSGGSGGGWSASFGNDGGHNVDADPLFVDSPNGNVRLGAGSPAVDGGNNTPVLTVTLDLDANPRTVGGIVDMGAYEFQGCPGGPVAYVDKDATGSGDGSSWGNAFTELRQALGALDACPGFTEIWVAEGIYKPTASGDPEVTFELRNGVGIYGGFSGAETTRSQRDWVANVTVLSGDIGTTADSTDNSYHVVTGVGPLDSSTVLDGFTITGGRAYGAFPDDAGGGMVNGAACNPTLVNLTFLRNSALSFGGGLSNIGYYINSSSPTLTNVVFSGNSAAGGGGMSNQGNYSSPVLTNVVFSGNSADYGGGLFMGVLNSNATLTNVTFAENSATGPGGGMYNSGQSSNATLVDVTFAGNSAGNSAGNRGGGMFNDESDPMLVNVNFSGNSGGGMANYDGGEPTLGNVVFSENVGGGGQMLNWYNSNPTLINVTFSSVGCCTPGLYNLFNSHPILINTIIWEATGSSISGDGAVISYSLIKGSGGSGAGWNPSMGTDGGGNIDSDPLFVGAQSGNLRLTAGSPAVNAGNNAAIPSGVTTDLDGNSRNSGGTVDMGAYEFQFPAVAEASPSPLVFGPAPVNQTTCDTVTVANTGSGTMTIYGISGCAAAPFSVDTTQTAHTIQPGGTTRIVVCVTPTSQGPDSCTVTVVSNATNSPTVIPVRLDIVTAVGSDTPQPFRIVSVSPNPFNPSTTVHFTLPAVMDVTAVIWSVTGARVKVLSKQQRFVAGDNRLVWDGRDDRGSPVASGVYFIRLETRLGTKVARAVLLK